MASQVKNPIAWGQFLRVEENQLLQVILTPLCYSVAYVCMHVYPQK